jgi:hypothetical protein
LDSTYCQALVVLSPGIPYFALQAETLAGWALMEANRLRQNLTFR